MITLILDVPYQALKMNNKALGSITNSLTVQKCFSFSCCCNNTSLESVSFTHSFFEICLECWPMLPEGLFFENWELVEMPQLQAFSIILHLDMKFLGVRLLLNFNYKY